jgi:hypothetical protein
MYSMQTRTGVRVCIEYIRCRCATFADHLIDKVLAQEQDLFIIASSVEK